MDAEQANWVQVKEELLVLRRDASRQHARELQLELRQAHMSTAALKCQVRLCPYPLFGGLLIGMTVKNELEASGGHETTQTSFVVWDMVPSAGACCLLV